MASVSVKVDSGALLKALRKAPNEVSKEVRKGLGEASEIIVEKAKRVHRYKTRSGIADKSIVYKISRTRMPTSKIWLEYGISPYSNRLHRGFGSWAPDPFLYNALKLVKKEVRGKIEKSFDNAIKKAGLT